MVILQKCTTPVCQNTAVRCRKECCCYHGSQDKLHFRGVKLGDSAAVYNISLVTEILIESVYLPESKISSIFVKFGVFMQNKET